MRSGHPDDDPASLSKLIEIDKVCDDFDAAWSAGNQPHLRDYLARCSTQQQSRGFRDLLEIELEYRRGREELVQATTYANQFPEFQSEIDTVFARFRDQPTANERVGVAPEFDWSDEVIGQVIGRYKLLKRLGTGGFGVVYLAEQQAPVRRQVALKIIKLGMDTEQVIARFEAERQALAVMTHPNIATVLDAGATQSGRPFFVMELVNGLPITTYCDQQALPLDERLKLFCEGLRRGTARPPQRDHSSRHQTKQHSGRRTGWFADPQGHRFWDCQGDGATVNRTDHGHRVGAIHRDSDLHVPRAG